MSLDITDTLLADSTQLNAADLTEPILVRIEKVKRHESKDGKQPIEIAISGGWKPWRPCKGARRILAALWGKDGSAYVGRFVRLFNDSSVTFGKESTGGIRIAGLSDIERTQDVSIPVARGRYVTYRIERIERPVQPSIPSLEDLLKDQDVTIADLDRVRATTGKPPVSTLSPEEQAKIAAYFFANPNMIAKLKENQS